MAKDADKAKKSGGKKAKKADAGKPIRSEEAENPAAATEAAPKAKTAAAAGDAAEVIAEAAAKAAAKTAPEPAAKRPPALRPAAGKPAARAPRAPRRTKAETEARQSIIDQCKWMNGAGLNQGTSGNISVRWKDRMLITPSAIAYDAMTPDMIASMPLEDPEAWEGPNRPSSEWRFHLDILRAREDVHAIVHTHAMFSTVLAIARKEIPAVHYMIAVFGGPTVRCADYALFGTQALSDNALKALEGRNACLLANHGMIAAGPTLDRAMWLAVELETLAKQYYHTLQIGGGVVLRDAQIEETAEQMRSPQGYGA